MDEDVKRLVAQVVNQRACYDSELNRWYCHHCGAYDTDESQGASLSCEMEDITHDPGCAYVLALKIQSK